MRDGEGDGDFGTVRVGDGGYVRSGDPSVATRAGEEGGSKEAESGRDSSAVEVNISWREGGAGVGSCRI